MNDNKGLITSYLLDGKGGGKNVDWDDINAWEQEQGLLWVHLDYTDPHAFKWLTQQSGLDKITLESLTSEESRPRTVINHDFLLVILRGVNLNPGQDVEDMVSVRVIIEKNRIITTRKRRLLSIDDIRALIDNNVGPKTSGDFLSLLNSRLLRRISDVCENIEDHVDNLEQDVISTESKLLRPRISDIRREVILLRRYLAPQREALGILYADDTALLSKQNKASLRESTDKIIRYIENLDASRDRASITQEELSNKIAEQANYRMYILSVVAMIFLPLSFITGLLGVNLGGIPGEKGSYSFAILCVILFAMLFLLIWALSKKKWI